MDCSCHSPDWLGRLGCTVLQVSKILDVEGGATAADCESLGFRR